MRKRRESKVRQILKERLSGYEPRLSEARIHACYLPDCKALTALGTTVSVHQCNLLSQSIFQHEDQLLLPRKLINILKRDQWWNVGSSKDQQWWSTKHWKTPEKCRRAITEPWISSKYWQIVTHKSPCLAFKWWLVYFIGHLPEQLLFVPRG